MHASTRRYQIIVAGLLVPILLTATSATHEPLFELKITEFAACAGIMTDYHITPSRIVLIRRDDFGSPPKELLRIVPESSEVSRLESSLRQLPLDMLADSYVDDRVDDGWELTFEIQVDLGTKRRIHLANMCQKDLSSLCEQVNRMVGVQHKLIVPCPYRP